MNKWQDSSLSLGERCVAFAENEMNNGVGEDKPNSFTSPRLREYFAICTRLVNGKETPLTGFTAGNWCSAGASFCLHESLLSGETHPHGYRLGVVEVVTDMQHNNIYYTVDKVRDGSYQIKVGDIIIFDRSNPNNPASTWWRHIGRVYSVDSPTNFKCISGNNGGKWRISNHQLSQTNLLGFGEYPKLNTKVNVNTTPQPIPDWSNTNILDLVPPQDTGSGIDFTGIFEQLNLFK